MATTENRLEKILVDVDKSSVNLGETINVDIKTIPDKPKFDHNGEEFKLENVKIYAKIGNDEFLINEGSLSASYTVELAANIKFYAKYCANSSYEDNAKDFVSEVAEISSDMKTVAKNNVDYKKRNENIMGWLFVSPLMLGLGLFLLFPLLFAIFVSFTDYSMYSEYSFFDFQFKFVGFQNYVAAFQNEDFLRSLYNAIINCIGVPIGIVLAVFFTNLIIRNPKGSLFFRTLFYLPTICGAVIITFIWKWIFTLIPQVLRDGFNVSNLNLLTGDNFLRSMIIMGVWSGIGTSVLMVYSAMKGVDKTLYESAQIDGANGFNQLMHITIPAISPVAFYILLTGISGSLQDFSRFQVMGGGTASWYSNMPVWEIYTQVNAGGNLAYGSALGVILGLIIIALSVIQFVISKLWVHSN